ncbi:SAM-dependent methyltransferase [Bradyrhizobium ottawaense]|uniref:nodulation methyltransferase NodS n=1 Tax=Bradyrhizobium TaxID=374 RepID=UPI000BE973C5|nr:MULTISPECIES: nodulation methyltransferase NodS [Bradyrhizobium]MDA9392002.1 SAM-dependent methyltransferase [Bradyrhizobium sp. CCBAU 45394]MDA9490985.1 SAM-dependent methyltransferase [Bradyrhizobium sp. CCBAU 11361]MDA9537248.1 SAM-dependent methyltransferase [Bradyrhizobium sp. CCBAU 21362]PDT68941.1 SAM-dependent methyltransferase [Bradyrhizobium ottawaense]QHP73108.1 methyltransferase [Bradyrhizobium sp. LCT2]
MISDKNHQLLERELAVDDPWRLDSSSFEQERYAQMLRMSRCGGDVAYALEVGCAAGAFTDRLAPLCERLTVVDVMPQAIERARLRTRKWSHITWVTCDIQRFSTTEQFDLIVVAEVLYYLKDIVEMHAAIRNLVSMLAPNGALIFGSARDATCQRWGHTAGAETVIGLFNESLSEVERLHCHTGSVNEDCLIVRFRKQGHPSEQSNVSH